jgi:hypothetical protein
MIALMIQSAKIILSALNVSAFVNLYLITREGFVVSFNFVMESHKEIKIFLFLYIK